MVKSKEQLPYNDMGQWLKRLFPFKVQKISIDAGFSCPNRDGSKGHGGCTFCDNQTFNPSYCDPKDNIKTQLERGKLFFSRKYPDMKYLAYFQAYSNTYAPVDVLKQRYEEALAVDGVVGLVIGTRPDCVNDETLDYLAELSQRTFLLVEYGIESTNNNVLQRINRHHTFECGRDAVVKSHERSIMTGAHFILGLPGEEKDEWEKQAHKVSKMPIDVLKLHQLQVVRNTPLAQQYIEQPFALYSLDEYLSTIANYLEHLRPSIVVDRFVSQSPKGMVLAPQWGIKNHEFVDKLKRFMFRNNMFQGKKWEECY